MNKHYHWLAEQLPKWVDKNIISHEQAEILQTRYPVKDSVSLGRLLITGIGAIMIGLGIILLFAYNWSEMGKYLKLAVIFGAFITAHASAFWAIKRNNILSESLFALGTMLMGASIFLVGQIYHLDSHYPDAFLLWSVGALTLAWALPSLTQAFMTIVLILSWHMLEVFNFQFANYTAFLIIIAGVFPLIWRLHSPLLARFTSASLFITLGLSIATLYEEIVPITLLMMSVAFICIDQFFQVRGNNTQTIISNEIAKPAQLILVVMLFLLSFGEFFNDIIYFHLAQPIASTFFWCSMILSQLIFVWLLVKRQLSAIVVMAELTVLLILLPSLLSHYIEAKSMTTISMLMVFAFNLILLGTSIWLMVDGAKHANRQRMVRGSIIFAILAMARYTDLFDSLIARAIVFLVVGIALFIVGNIYQRNKKGLSQ